jgi:hypothetical protein
LLKEDPFVDIKPYNQTKPEVESPGNGVVNWLLEHSQELKKRSIDLHKDIHCYGNIKKEIVLSQFVICLKAFTFLVYGRNDKSQNIELNSSKASSSKNNGESEDAKEEKRLIKSMMNSFTKRKIS